MLSWPNDIPVQALDEQALENGVKKGRENPPSNIADGCILFLGGFCFLPLLHMHVEERVGEMRFAALAYQVKTVYSRASTTQPRSRFLIRVNPRPSVVPIALFRPRGWPDRLLWRLHGPIETERITSCIGVRESERGGIGLQRFPVHEIG
jgi:hypothetical protein